MVGFSDGEWWIEATTSCMYSRAVATHSTPWNGNVKLSQKPKFKLPGGSKFKHFMIHLGFALENSEMNMTWAHSEKLQLTTSPKNPFPQQNTPWVPNIDVAPRRLEEAFGAAFHAHVDGLKPLSVRWRQHQDDEKTIMFSPYNKPSKKQTHNKSCNSRLKIQSLLIQTLGLWCSSSHVLLKQSWRSPGLPQDDTPETIFRVWFKLRPFP